VGPGVSWAGNLSLRLPVYRRKPERSRKGACMASREPVVPSDAAAAGAVKPRSPWRVLGPGLITGASDDDPSGIATYSQAGAGFGFALSWTLLLSWPLMCAIQEISARIGRVTGHGLAGNLVRHYPRPLVL